MQANNQTNRKDKSPLLAFFLISLSILFWGVSFISTKVVLTEIPPVSIAFFRQLIAIVPLAAWVLHTRTSVRIEARDLVFLALSCFFGIVLYFVFENNGLALTSASSASMIVSSVPIFTFLSEAIFFRVKITARTILCILLSIGGVYLVISVNGIIDLSSGTILGNLLVLGAMVSWVVYTVLSRGLSKRYSSLVITTYQTGISVFLFIPFIMPEIARWRPVTVGPLLNLIYLGVFCSALSYLFFLYGIQKLGATIPSVFLNLIPVVTVAAGYFLLGEKLTFTQLTGMLFIIASLYALNRKKN